MLLLLSEDCVLHPVVFIVQCTFVSSHLEYYLDLLSVNDIYISCSQVSDWAIDYSVSGGTDKEGWQYAADFPVYVDF